MLGDNFAGSDSGALDIGVQLFSLDYPIIGVECILAAEGADLGL